MVPKEQIQASVMQFILTEFLAGEEADELELTTPLVSAGILDSIATLKLVTFLEEQFEVQIEAHEVDVDHLNTVEDISNLVLSKL